MTEPWEPTASQCLCCGGRGGWWTGETRTNCDRCQGDGWDPARAERWFHDLIAPLQQHPNPNGVNL